MATYPIDRALFADEIRVFMRKRLKQYSGGPTHNDVTEDAVEAALKALDSQVLQ